MVNLKRIYDPVGDHDGERILVDRLWPRGVSRQAAALDSWNKAVAPSPELRQWFGHQPERFEEFRRKYLAELAHNEAAQQLQQDARHRTLTLLYAAKDPLHNHARVLQEFLTRTEAR